jgi:beta-galactosidase
MFDRKIQLSVNKSRRRSMPNKIKNTNSLFTLICSLCLWGFIICSETVAQPYVPQNSNRVKINMNAGWLYSPTDIANGQSPTLNEGTFQQVCLPHTVKVMPLHITNFNDYRIISWYRRHITLPSGYTGRRIILEFQGVGTVATVYVNGNQVGQHKGAYTSFSYDITNNVTLGSDNVIVVQVDSRERTDVPPEGNIVDYCLFGGIVRDVNLNVVDPLHVDRVFASTPIVSASSAVVNARTNVINNGTAQKNCTITTSIVDSTTNSVVATGSATHVIAAGSSYEFNYNTTAISSPKLWHPNHPYLYKVYTQVQDGSQYVDEQQVRIGVRSVVCSKTDGKCYINGQPFKLCGTNRHETYPFIGRAAADRIQAKEADILKFDMGCNTIRLSHYPQNPAFLDRCDEIGLLLLEEIPGWEYVGDTAWQALCKQNVVDMVSRDRNHPSIILWGTRVNESNPDNPALFASTYPLAKGLDTTRSCIGVYGPWGTTWPFSEDVFGLNDYSGLVTVFTPPRFPFLITECADWTYKSNSFSPEDTLLGRTFLHAAVQNDSYGKSNALGALSWCAFTYNSPFTYCAINSFVAVGMADIFRIPMYATYLYKSQMDPSLYGPMVYIANYWMSNSPKNVTIFSNCEEIELFINGVSQGIQKPSLYMNLPHPVFQFTNVTFQAGELKATGKIGGNIVATHIRHTPGQPVRLVMTPDTTALVVGGDMTRVVVTAVDSFGQVVPRAGNTITLSATGAGIFLGQSPIALEDGKTAFFVQTKAAQTGTITCQATGGTLTSASAQISVAGITEILPSIRKNSPALAQTRSFAIMRVVGARITLPHEFEGKPVMLDVHDLQGKCLVKTIVRGRLLDLQKEYGISQGVYIVRCETMKMEARP